MSQCANFFLVKDNNTICIAEHNINDPLGEPFKDFTAYGEATEVNDDYLDEVVDELERREKIAREAITDVETKFNLYCKTITINTTLEEKQDQINEYMNDTDYWKAALDGYQTARHFCDFLRGIIYEQTYEENPATLICGIDYWPPDE